MEEWKTYRIGDICKTNTSQYSTKEAWDEFLYLDTGNITRNTIDEIARYSSTAELPSRARRKVISDDIIFSTVRPNQCHFGILSNPPANLLVSTGFTVITANKEIVDPYYLYYYLTQDSIVDYLHSIGEQAVSAYPSIKAQDIEDLEIELPDLSTQNNIAKTLRALDKKIQLNRQINDNLEQQASSLLSDWISTYPCRTYKLSDICKYANAKCETGNLTPQNYISTENMLPNKKGIVEASNIPTGKATCYKVDDVLIANIRPYFQKIWKADINGGCSADVLCIRANIESHSPILYWLLHQDAFFEYVMTGAKGCKMPRGDKQHIMNWSIDLPEVQYWADLATQLGSIDQQIAYNRIESINLSNLRDTLLPKLMSGELKINEIDCELLIYERVENI